MLYTERRTVLKRLLLIALFVFVLAFVKAIIKTECADVSETATNTTSVSVAASTVAENVIEEIEVTEEIEVVEEEYVETIAYTTYDIPKNKGFKSYMDYKAITSRSSKQFQLQNLYANTSDCGIRVVNDRYCIAVGMHFDAEIGQYLDLILENGVIIPCVLSDVKADIHTDESNIVTLANGCVSEFVVDTPSLYNTAKKMGDISYCYAEWRSPVVQIVVYEQNVFNQ